MSKKGTVLELPFLFWEKQYNGKRTFWNQKVLD